MAVSTGDVNLLLLEPSPAYQQIKALGIYLVPPVAPVTEARDQVSVALDLPAGAIVGAAEVALSAQPAGRARLGDVARVRAADNDTGAASTKHVVDFGGLRSVSSLTTDETLTSLHAWLGTAFDDAGIVTVAGGDHEVRFDEIRTERLLVVTAGTTADALAAGGAVTLSDPPADLEVLVDGQRVHFVPGPARGPGATHEETVDVTAAVQAAVDAGTSPVTVTLRSSVPGQLSVAPAQAYLHAHHVAFPEGPRRTVAAREEGVVDVRLPLAPNSASWRIRLVRLELAATVGDERVLPPTGPEFGTQAELVCDPDRPLVVRLPPSALGRLGEVRAVRLPVRAGGPAELAGFLRAEAPDPFGVPGPGDELPDATFVPTAVEGSDDYRWTTLPLARPVAVEPGAGIWAVAQATRGMVHLPLAAAGPPEEQAMVRRQAPNGQFRPLPTVATVATSALGLRVVGVAPATGPIDAVVVGVPVDAGLGTAPDAVLATTPAQAPAPHELAVTELVTGAEVAARSGDELVLRLIVTGPGDYTVGPVTVGYVETS